MSMSAMAFYVSKIPVFRFQLRLAADAAVVQMYELVCNRKFKNL